MQKKIENNKTKFSDACLLNRKRLKYFSGGTLSYARVRGGAVIATRSEKKCGPRVAGAGNYIKKKKKKTKQPYVRGCSKRMNRFCSLIFR